MNMDYILEEKVNDFIIDLKIIESNFYYLTTKQMSGDKLLDYLSEGKKNLEEKISAIDALCTNIEKLFSILNNLNEDNLKILNDFIEILKLTLTFLKQEYKRIKSDFEKYNFHKELIEEYKDQLSYLDEVINDLITTFFELPKDKNYTQTINDLI